MASPFRAVELSKSPDSPHAVDGGAPPVSLSPASSTTLSGEQPNMYLRLTHDAPRLTGELQATVNMILRGTNSMRPSHIDMIGLPDTGIRWWKVAPDFVKRLYFECFALCTLSQEYRAMAPVEVQKMVAALEVSSRIIQDRVAEVSLANAIAEDQAGQYSKFNSSTAFPIDVVTSIMRHRELLPINLFQLYPRNYSAFNSRPNTTTDTQIRHVRAGSPEAPEMVGVDDTGMTSEDEQSIRSNSSADNASSFNDTGSENSNSLLSARRLERSRVSATSASSHKESNSDADEPVCPSKRLSRLKVLAQIEVSHEEEDSDYEPIRPSKRFQPSRVPIRSARSPDDVQSKDEPIRLLKRFVRPKVPARSTTSFQDVQSDDEHICPTRRLKRSGALAKPHENEERDDDEPVRPAKRPKRSKAPVKSAKSHKDVESDDDEPSDTEKLAPGKKFVCWSNGSLRASRAIRGINDRDLPTTALNGPVHELESTCTHPNVDVRLYDFELSVEEILTYFPLHTSWREVCWRIAHTWPAIHVIEFIYWTRNLMGKKTAGRSTLQCRFKAARKWADDALRELREERVRVGGPAVVESTSTLTDDTGPALKSSMDAIALESGNRGRGGGPPFYYFISDLSEGVQIGRHPTGKGAQLLTRMIEHARNAGKTDLRLSAVSNYARQHSISVPHADRLSNFVAAEDKAALDRHQDTIRKFYRDRFTHAPK